MAHRTPGPGNRFAYAESPAKQRHGRELPDTSHNPNELGRIRILLPVVCWTGSWSAHRIPQLQRASAVALRFLLRFPAFSQKEQHRPFYTSPLSVFFFSKTFFFLPALHPPVVVSLFYSKTMKPPQALRAHPIPLTQHRQTAGMARSRHKQACASIGLAVRLTVLVAE